MAITRGKQSGGHGRGIPIRAHKATVAANEPNTSSGTTQTSSLTNGAAGIVGITPDQWQQLLDALHASKIRDRLRGKNDTAWIIDTSATNHVTWNLNCMINVTQIPNVLIELSDGKDVTTKEGSVILDGGL